MAVPVLPRHVLIPLIVACALFMEQVDSTVISTSLPAIADSLNEDPVSLKLALTSYLLSLAVFIPASGWAADRYGARTVFRSAIVIFTLGSVLCGLSTSLMDFVLYRAIQGMGGAMMVPVGRLVILRSIPKAELVSALAWLTVPALIGPVLGPVIGGFITTYFDWRLIFFINVPIGILGVILATRFIENVREEDVPPLDLHGLVLSGVGLSGLVFGLAVMGEEMVPFWVAAAITGIGAVTFGFYIAHARRTPNAVLDLGLLRIATFRVGIIGASIFRIGIGAIPFLLPLMLQVSFGLSPLASGLLTFASSAGAMVMKATAAPIIRRFGFRRVLVFNSLLSAAFIAANAAFTPETPHLVITTVLLIGGFFRSLEFTALNAIAYADVDQHDMSRATSFVSVAQQISISLGVAVAGMVLETMRGLRGSEDLLLSDFTPAFLIVAAISATSIFSFLQLSKDAGAEMAGRKAKPSTLPDPRGEDN
ncbi:DHA2 family efflux MFS transporter permease subunit [Aquabacter spiritensis]|uniref:EmrB/QacA subfamily drug resistance transporter n=1 Tax=Aquabacter spiritensis TaxID=933073 RepID=A0A4R3M9N1_9HYPH|nr:DHA2 family efflux MFS transporter permease subunit [Aquabacter spiritensis]TCT08085.1 EmrB/QacA subfamily drug resistance transporter [Aquabacter spiritensis]